MKRSLRRSSLSYRCKELFQLIVICCLFFFDCKSSGEDPGNTLITFFNLINEGKYERAASLCVKDIDPYLLNFTYVVPIRFIEKVIVKKCEVSGDIASFYVYLFLKDGRKLAYYKRTRGGYLRPGKMQMRRSVLDNGKSKWKLECGEFWETYHWQDISRKIRLDIIALTEKAYHYRDSTGILPESLGLIWCEELDSVVNPVTGEKEVFVECIEKKPGVISFCYNRKRDEIDIKGYDALGDQLDYYIVSNSEKKEKAQLMEFFDVPPITITTVTPEYPESERQRGTEGTVSLKLLIGRDGKVHEAKIERHVSPVFDSIAIQAVKHSVFSPAKREGKPVAVWYYFPVRFKIDK